MAATLKTDRLQNKTDTTDNIILNSSGATSFGGAVDINSGAIDGTTIGAATPADATFVDITGTSLKATGGGPLSLKEDSGTTVISIEADGDVVIDPKEDATGTISVGSDVRQSMIMDAKTAGEGFESGGTSAGIGLGVGKMYAGITGEIKMYGGSLEPEGWVFCDGSAYDGAASGKYNNLFDVISTTYGNGGGGSNMFNVPDMRGRVPAGMDDMDSLQGVAANGTGAVGTGGGNAGRITASPVSYGSVSHSAGALGAAGGTETHLLTSSESGTGSHEHTVPGATTNSQDVTTTLSGSAHTHSAVGRTNNIGYNASGKQFLVEYGDAALTETTEPESSHTHTYEHEHGTPARSTTGGSAASAASAHTNLQPYLCINYIIKL